MNVKGVTDGQDLCFPAKVRKKQNKYISILGRPFKFVSYINL